VSAARTNGRTTSFFTTPQLYRMLRRMTTWAMVAIALAAAAPAKRSKAKKADPAAAATDAAIKSALDAEQAHIADCVVADSPQGAWSVTVKATVKINGAGQVMAADIKVEPVRPDTTRACIDKVLRAVTYPKSPAPMISISREWAFAMK
jgi:hypothetical protein